MMCSIDNGTDFEQVFDIFVSYTKDVTFTRTVELPPYSGCGCHLASFINNFVLLFMTENHERLNSQLKNLILTH
jgi:hypothetical protein